MQGRDSRRYYFCSKYDSDAARGDCRVSAGILIGVSGRFFYLKKSLRPRKEKGALKAGKDRRAAIVSLNPGCRTLVGTCKGKRRQLLIQL
jgi:hypothetical protein